MNESRNATPKSQRLHIGIFGRRNAGKSSLLNALTRQEVAIVSDIAGTTTDPVEKPMELLPIGPVLFIDTAGIDDVGALGALRVEKTRQVVDRTDVALLVVEAGTWTEFEQALLSEFARLQTPVIVVFNKCDLSRTEDSLLAELRERKIEVVETVARGGDAKAADAASSSGAAALPATAAATRGILELREALVRLTPDELLHPPPIVADLVPPGEMAVLVVPIDKEAPKGRLILPQVQTIRDLLDGDAHCLVVKERELRNALERLKRPPALVVTDSQAFLKVAGDTPASVKMTSFSILFARQKGDLRQFVEGAASIERLRPGDRVLVAESCTHHPIADDIGRVKIPRWLEQYVGGKLDIGTMQGRDFPQDLANYRLVVHCGGCMWNRREMLSRMLHCRAAGVPISNYGLTIAYTLGIFDRALEPFPDALDAYRALAAQS